jgi:hypothetical protein
VHLAPGSYSVARIDSVDQLEATANRLAQLDSPQSASAVIFRCQSE